MSSFEQRNKVGAISDIPLAFGTVLFSMEAIGAVSTKSEVIIYVI